MSVRAYVHMFVCAPVSVVFDLGWGFWIVCFWVGGLGLVSLLFLSVFKNNIYFFWVVVVCSCR